MQRFHTNQLLHNLRWDFSLDCLGPLYLWYNLYCNLALPSTLHISVDLHNNFATPFFIGVIAEAWRWLTLDHYYRWLWFMPRPHSKRKKERAKKTLSMARCETETGDTVSFGACDLDLKPLIRKILIKWRSASTIKLKETIAFIVLKGYRWGRSENKACIYHISKNRPWIKGSLILHYWLATTTTSTGSVQLTELSFFTVHP